MSCGNCKNDVNNGGKCANADRAGCRYCRNFDCKCRKHPYEENSEYGCNNNCYCYCGCVQPYTGCCGNCGRCCNNGCCRGFDDGFGYNNCSCNSHNNVNNCGNSWNGCQMPRTNYERGYEKGFDDGYGSERNCSKSCGNTGSKEFYDTGYDKGFNDGRNCGGCNQRMTGYERGYERGFDDGFSTDGFGNPNVPIMHNPCTTGCGSWNSCDCRCNRCNNGCGCNHC